MNLITPLCTGVEGAGDGFAVIKRRGTSALAVCYGDFKGTVISQPTGGFPLDANGGVEPSIYVNELVDVTVTTSDGTPLRTFTVGDAAPSVEVQSQSFTGTDYTSGVRAAGKPTTLQSVLDLWKTSAGALDFNVLFGDAGSTSLQNALGSLAGIFRNVKSPQYGAVGDGVTDDTVTIQNALNGGDGIVWFPEGRYRTTVKLSVPLDVSLWGPGAAASSILIDHGSASCLEYTGSSTGFQEVRGLSILCLQVNTGAIISLAALGATKLAVVNSLVGDGFSTGKAISIGSGAQTLLVDESSIQTAYAGSGGIIHGVDNSVEIQLRNSTVTAIANTFNGQCVAARNLKASDSTLSLAAVTSATPGCLCIDLDGTAGHGPRAVITGCEFIPGAAVDGAIELDNANDSTTNFVEGGNIFRTGFTLLFAGCNAGSNFPKIQLLSRDATTLTASAPNSASLNVNAEQYGVTYVLRTTNTAQTLTTAVGPPGALWSLVYVNGSAGTIAAGDVTLGSGFVAGVASFPATNLLTTHFSIYHFRSVVVAGGGGAWMPIAGPVNI